MAYRPTPPDQIRPPDYSIGIFQFCGGSGPYDRPNPDGSYPPTALRRGAERLLRALLRRRTPR